MSVFYDVTSSTFAQRGEWCYRRLSDGALKRPFRELHIWHWGCRGMWTGNDLTPRSLTSKGWLEGSTGKNQKERVVLKSSYASRVWWGIPQRS